MDRTRIDRERTGPDDRTQSLDRAWAATRPVELSAEAFDRIWAEVRRAYEARPTTLAMPPAPAIRRRTIALVAFGLAQAAAVLVAVWALNRPSAPTERAVPVEVVRGLPILTTATVVFALNDVEADETLILHMGGGDGPTIAEFRRPPEANPSLAMLDLPEHTPSDMLGHLEALSR
jgi:hypothetical protein